MKKRLASISTVQCSRIGLYIIYIYMYVIKNEKRSFAEPAIYLIKKTQFTSEFHLQIVILREIMTIAQSQVVMTHSDNLFTQVGANC